MGRIRSLFSKHYVQKMFNVLTDGILIADRTGEVIWLNQAVLNRVQIDAKEIIGSNVTELEKKGIFKPSVTKMVLNKQAAVKEIQSNYFYKNKKRSYIISGYPIKDEYGAIEFVVIHSQYIPEIVEATPQLKDTQALLRRYSQEIRKIQYEDQQLHSQNHYFGKSPIYESLLETIDRIAPTDSTVLITGETGVGKTFLAKRIHQLSDRESEPFVEVNCGAIPETLIESELFGYEKAAFTGASPSGKAGLIKMANGGTLFLDEIGELPIHLQVKFLQFLQEKTFLPIGATRQETANVRIIAATNRNLSEEVSKGTFRSDLYYRLNVLPLRVPSLRERREDIIGLIQFNLNKYNKQHNRSCYLAKEVIETLQNYDWPGNIRELENLIERFVLIIANDEVTLEDVPSYMRVKATNEDPFNLESFSEENTLTNYLEEIEKEIIIKAYKKYRTTRVTADKLGVTQSLLMRRIKKYNIEI